MLRRFVGLFIFFAFVLQSLQAQTFSRGVPASVVSPTPDGQMHGAPASVVSPTANGQTHGAPASVLSPTPLPPGLNPPLRAPFIRTHGPLRRFGSPRIRHQVFVPVPLFYSYYTDPGYYPSAADPTVADPAQQSADPAQAQQQQQPANNGNNGNDDDLRAAYLQGARDALTQKDDSRYGEHFLDSRERDRQQTVADATDRSLPAAAQPPQDDKTPATVFVFKDGHQLETKNYAIMGETLFDFSGIGLKKIKMADIDTTATVKANDDRGVIVKLQ